jgi:hypothetical protein
VPPKGEAEGLPVPRCTGLERGGDEVLAVPSEPAGVIPAAPLESESAGLKENEKRKDKEKQPEEEVCEIKRMEK